MYYLFFINQNDDVKIILCQNSSKTIHKQINLNFKEDFFKNFKDFLSSSKVDLKDVSIIGSVVGPGRYSTIREVLALVNSLAFSINAEIVGITHFDILEHSFKLEAKNMLILIDDTKEGFFGKLILEKDDGYIKAMTKEDVSGYIKDYPNIVVIGSEHQTIDYSDKDILETFLKIKQKSSNIFKPLKALYIKDPKITLKQEKVCVS